MIKIIYSILLVLAIWAFVSWFFVRNIESQSYTVIEEKNGYEVRKYDKHIVASAKVRGNQNAVTNEGFRIVADYIFGNNTSNESIAMTTPVIDEKNEEIAMTTPVIDEINDEGEHVISFVMPSKYTLENLPKPNSEKVIITEVPEKIYAVLKFSWYPYEIRVNKKKEILKKYLKRDGMFFNDDKDPILSRFNPPFTMPLLLRNEVLIEVSK
ncbi:MAG: heme-binding protein [Anaerolineae bacterium]|nr:heme-binding protein [Anaerolineae bacterium]